MLNLMLKAKYSFISALVFFIVANPETYKFTQTLFGGLFKVAEAGAATPAGLLLHTAVFFFAMWGLMMVPRL
jgi:hypothetical protein